MLRSEQTAERRPSDASFSQLTNKPTGWCSDVNSEFADACDAGNLELMQRLLVSGTNPNQRDVLHGGTPLHLAVGHGNLEGAGLPLKSGADPNIATQNTSTTPLGLAAIAGNLEMVKLLVSAGAQLSPSEIGTGVVAECKELGFLEIAATIERSNGTGTLGEEALPSG